jgi:hypothetical protein
MKRFITLTVCLVGSYVYSQNTIPLKSLLIKLDSTTENTFYYKDEWVDELNVKNIENGDHLMLIREALSNSGFKLYVHQGKYVFIYPNRLEFEKQNLLIQNEAKDILTKTIRIGDPDNFDISQEYELTGIVQDESDEPLIGVNIQIDGKLVSKTESDGTYKVNLTPGNYEIKYTYIGLESETRLITFYSSGDLNISLFQDSKLLDEVVVEGSSIEQGSGMVSIGVQKISIEKLEKLPSFLGNVDVIKSATALPGVTVAGESSSYLNVRGGTNDQTKILMNNTTIYNPGHLLGFFSVFNGDFISDMTIYKGHIPPKYGMRASSVLDVKMNKWATEPLNVYGGVGLVDSNIGVKAKLLDEKLDIHLGGRASYIGWILDLVPDKDVINSRARFGDANFSSRYILDEKNSLFFSSYWGSDFFRYADRIVYKWNTFNNELRWSRLLNEEWVLETELTSSTLNNSSEGLELNEEFIFKNGISEYSLKTGISNDHFEGGVQFSNYDLSLGDIQPTTNNSLVRNKAIDEENLFNVGIHVNYLTRFMDEKIEINSGVRLNYFMNYGFSTLPVYEENMPFLPENIVGSRSFGSSNVSYSKATLEPRVGVNYYLNNNTLRASYSRTNQFIHMIANTVLINPSTVWKGSDSFIPPTQIDQYSVGVQHDFDKSEISISLDGFYKNMTDLVEYRNGADLIINDRLEQEIVRGKGRSYGIEFLLTKDKGDLTGIFSYTYARTLVSVNDKLQDVKINGGSEYPYYTDRPHSFKTSIDWKATKKWTISSNFTYITGAPISAPLFVFNIEGVRVPYFSERNSERIPDYHRMDLVITFKSRIRKTKKNNDRLVLTLYNLYGRRNVANVYFSAANDEPAQPFQLINVGNIIPTLTYKFEF